MVNSMLKMVDADLFVMVDGDDTYPAGEVHNNAGGNAETESPGCGS